MHFSVDREIVSFRACERANGRGEAKLRVGARRCSSHGWGSAPRRVLRAAVRPAVPHCRCGVGDMARKVDLTDAGDSLVSVECFLMILVLRL